MIGFEKKGLEIRFLAKELILEFMSYDSRCSPNQAGLKLAVIFRACGFDWGNYPNATSSNQQYWMVALMRELENEGKVQRVAETKHWKLL